MQAGALTDPSLSERERESGGEVGGEEREGGRGGGGVRETGRRSD